ncbi:MULTISPECIES: DUF4879 domain-containing protein [Pseudomonas]|nr:DUF4879 domain-containing protein [Pseudomonas corrugata]MBI6691972.1 DUF4879 domain-containing protein [Pseudomonas corrugata]
MNCMKNIALACAFGLGLSVPSAHAASAPPLSEVKVLKVESPACGFEDVSAQQAQTRCDHSGPHIKVYVLEVGIGHQPNVTLDGFEVDGTRSPVCAFDNGNLNDCSSGARRTVGYLYIFDLKGKQEGTFSFSNVSINAPGNRMSTQLYIK